MSTPFQPAMPPDFLWERCRRDVACSAHADCRLNMKMYLSKKILPHLAAASALLLTAGCGEKAPETVAISISGNDHNDDVWVAGFTINDEIGSGIGGSSCCVTLPAKWRPGLKMKVSWSYNKNAINPAPPPPQTAEVEIPEYGKRDLAGLDVHFFPGHKVKAVVTRYDIGSPFYPLPREDWYFSEVDQYIVDRYRKDPAFWTNHNHINQKDCEWAKQWGLAIPEKYCKH